MFRTLASFFVVLVVAVFPIQATAVPRTATLAAGDCEESTLANLALVFDEALRARVKDQVLDADQASKRLRPRPSASKEDLQRQLTVAQKHFYNLQQFKAEQQVEEALEEIVRLPPGAERRALTSTAYALRGVFRLTSNKNPQADEAFAQILRLDANYQLDPDYYSPSTRERFEQVRRKIATTPRKNVQVFSAPAGADVFLDGALVGKTPMTVKVIPGTYELQLVKGKLASFPHQLSVNGDTTTQVDLQFEGAVKATPLLCVSEVPGRSDLMTNANNLGALLGMEEVVVVRVRRNTSGSDWLTATLLNVHSAQELREGGMKIPVKPPPGAFDDLVSYVATGRAGPAVIVAAEGAKAPWAAAASAQRAGESTGVGEVSTTGPSGGSNLRSKAWIPLVAGGVLTATGVTFAIMARGTERAIRSRDSSITDVDSAIAKGQSFERLGAGFLITGIVALGVAGGMYWWGGSSGNHDTTVSFVPVPGGGVSMLSMNWD